MRFVCTTRCFIKDIYEEGQKLSVSKEAIVECPVCKGTKEVDGKECVKCRGTGRSYPPHHFKLLGDVSKQQKVDMDIDAEDEPEGLDEPKKEVTEKALEDMSKEELRAELKSLGKAWSPNASHTTLVTQVKLARTGKA